MRACLRRLRRTTTFLISTRTPRRPPFIRPARPDCPRGWRGLPRAGFEKPRRTAEEARPNKKKIRDITTRAQGEKYGGERLQDYRSGRHQSRILGKSRDYRAAKTLRDLRVAEIVQLDMQISNGTVEAY